MTYPATHILIWREKWTVNDQSALKTPQNPDNLALVIQLPIWLSWVKSVRKEPAFSYINRFLTGTYFNIRAWGRI